jgi:hypothetical protein
MCGDIRVLYNKDRNVFVKSLKPAVQQNARSFFLTHNAASSSKKTGCFMSFRRTIVVYFENRMKHVNSLRGQSAGFFNVKVGGKSKHCVLNS